MLCPALEMEIYTFPNLRYGPLMPSDYTHTARDPAPPQYIGTNAEKPPESTANPAPQQFSLAHLTLLHCSPPELTHIAASAGFDFVSLRIIPLNLPGEPQYPLAANKHLFTKTLEALCSTGVRVLDVELAKISHEVDINEYRGALECAARLGANHVLCSVWCTEFVLTCDKFSQLCELAAQFNLTVDLEFVPFAGIRTLTQATRVLRTCKRPNAGICVDTLHFDRTSSSIEALANLPAEWFHYAQICDAAAIYSSDVEDLKRVAREERLFLGDGGIDVRSILSALPAIPYSIETPNARLLELLGPELFAQQCLRKAKQIISDPGRRFITT